MTAEEMYKRLQPCGFKYIGAFDYKHIINECPRINGNLASTKNAMYCYADTEGWLRINSVSPLIFDVKDSGYVKGRGYYVVIDNSENFQIDTNSVIEYWLNGETVTEEIVGIEKRMLLLDPPHPASDWGLITRNKITPDGGLKEIMIKLYEQQIEEHYREVVKRFREMKENEIK